jgi:hypothetical protein
MVNANDHLGGANNFTTSVMFNTCRESGDHGDMNSWDRMPFISNIGTNGGAAPYAPALSETTGMFIIANYGAAQGYDNDDGSVRHFSLPFPLPFTRAQHTNAPSHPIPDS